MALDDEWNEADRYSRGGQWGEAGPRWLALARRCREEGQIARARDAASRAADALRRDDRPGEAAEALTLVWELGQATTVDALQLVAVLIDAGRVPEARARAEAARASAAPGPDLALAHDSVCAAALLAGDLPAARDALAALLAGNEPATRLAAAYRSAQLALREARLTDADALLAGVIEQLEPFPAAAAGEAAAHDERAAVAMARAALAPMLGLPAQGWLEVAAAHYERGRVAWQRARRRAGQIRNAAHADRVDALLAGNPGAVPDRAGVRYAVERGLVLLEAELRGLAAAAFPDEGELVAAVLLADGAPPLRGYARLWWAEATRVGPHVVRELEQARVELAGDQVGLAIASFRLGQLLGDAEALDVGRAIAAAALTEHEA